VAGLLRGIPQHGNTLGSPGAPITLQVFGDLECIDVKQWFGFLLPAILKELVRTNIVRLEYRSLKTDTLNPTVFVAQQTAALAAGAQGRMWNFLYHLLSRARHRVHQLRDRTISCRAGTAGTRAQL
jgi:hypothetical protein